MLLKELQIQLAKFGFQKPFAKAGQTLKKCFKLGIKYALGLPLNYLKKK